MATREELAAQDDQFADELDQEGDHENAATARQLAQDMRDAKLGPRR